RRLPRPGSGAQDGRGTHAPARPAVRRRQPSRQHPSPATSRTEAGHPCRVASARLLKPRLCKRRCSVKAPMTSSDNGEKVTALRTVLGLRYAVAIGACAVTAVLGSAITYAVAAPAAPPHTFSACARGDQVKAHTITVDSIPRCSKHET